MDLKMRLVMYSGVSKEMEEGFTFHQGCRLTQMHLRVNGYPFHKKRSSEGFYSESASLLLIKQKVCSPVNLIFKSMQFERRHSQKKMFACRGPETGRMPR